MIPLLSLSLAATASLAPLTVCAPVMQEDLGGEAARPRLVVLLSVDQMIPEQLTRLRPAFTGVCFHGLQRVGKP